jgi:hypothetical protein
MRMRAVVSQRPPLLDRFDFGFEIVAPGRKGHVGLSVIGDIK